MKKRNLYLSAQKNKNIFNKSDNRFVFLPTIYVLRLNDKNKSKLKARWNG